MSWLSKGLKKLEKNVIRPTAKVAQKVAPVALPILGTMIPGVGNVAGAALGGAIAGATRKGGNALTNAVGGAASGAALGGVGGAITGGVKAIANNGLKAGLASVLNRAAPAAAAAPSGAPSGGGIGGAVRGATSAITGGEGSLADIAKLLGTLGIGAAGLKAGHDAGKNAHELQRRQANVGNDLAAFGRASLASAGTLRDMGQSGLVARLAAGPSAPTDYSRFADTRNPFRSRYGGMPLLPPPPRA